MKTKSLKLNTILNIMRMMLTVLVPLITFPYTSRIFLTEGSGQLNFATSVVQIFTLYASLGIYTYGVREGTKVRHDRKLFSKLAQELLIINGVATIVTYIVFFLSVMFIPAFRQYALLLIINSFTIGFTALGLDWVYGVYEEYVYITVRQIIIQIFIIISMVVFVHNANDIYIWASLSVFSGVGANIFNFVHSRKYMTLRKNTEYRYEIKKHLLPIVLLFATQLAAKVYSNLDTILLGIFATDHNTGIYSAAVKVNTILITCFTAMSPVFMPRIVEYVKAGNDLKHIKFLQKIFTLVIAIALPAVVGIGILSKEIILILAGPAFVDATITMRILAPIILITACANIFYYNFLVPYGRERDVLLCTVIGAILNFLISIILIPHMQENGAAIGSLISEFIALIIAVLMCYKQNKNIIKGFPKIRNYLIGALVVIVWCVFCRCLVDNLYLYTVISVGGSVVLYGTLLFILKDPLRNEALQILRKFLKR